MEKLERGHTVSEKGQNGRNLFMPYATLKAQRMDDDDDDDDGNH